MFRNILIFIFSISLTACGFIYEPRVQQGNLLDQEMIDGLKPGMSKRQVALVLGTPALSDPFHADRWDYIASAKPHKKDLHNRRLTLIFEDGVLAEMQGNYFPTDAEVEE